MKNKDIEKTLFESDIITPSSDLKEKVIKECSPYVSEVREKKRYFPLKRVIAFASMVIVLFASIFSTVGVYNEKYESVYIDVNPSIELVVNRFNVINEINYIGDDAKQAFSNVKLKGKKIEKGLDIVMDTLDKKGYFEEAEMYISVSSERGKKAQKILDDLIDKAEKFKKDKNYSVNINRESFSKEERREAKKHDMSPTKYKIIKEIIDGNDEFTMDDLKDFRDKSMKDLKDFLDKLPIPGRPKR